MYTLEATPGRTVMMQDTEYLFFSGYSYLGMHHLPALQEALRDALEQYGWLFPSARISNTRLALFEQAEQTFAAQANSNGAVLFSSGFMAGRAAVHTIPAGAHVFSAPACHPAIACGTRSSGDFNAWAAATAATINQLPPEAAVYLLSDSVNPLTVEVHDFSFLQQIQRPLTCIIDDSHGLGLLGPQGQGISHLLPRIEGIEYIISASLSKALNLTGGIVCCSSPERLQQLRDSPWYGTTTPPPPALLHVWLYHQALFQMQRARLRELIQHLHTLLPHGAPIAQHPQLPILRLPPFMDEAFFRQHRMIISSFAYPDAHGPALNRAVISALHTKEDVEALATVINKTLTASCIDLPLP
jgi:7-keto-8-aminopelargonate synthetase-like enzyme